jgi:hypothetical protein
VFLDASDIQTDRPSKKLSHRRLGPFKVLEQVSSIAYRLELPRSMSRLHPVFNVVKLTPAVDDPIVGRHSEPPPDPIVVDGEVEYEVEEVLDSRWRYGRIEYLIKWRGFGVEHNSWEPGSHVFSPTLVADFHTRHPEAVTPQGPVRRSTQPRNTAIRSVKSPDFRMIRPGLYWQQPRVGTSRLRRGGDVRGQSQVSPGLHSMSGRSRSMSDWNDERMMSER